MFLYSEKNKAFFIKKNATWQFASILLGKNLQTPYRKLNFF